MRYMKGTMSIEISDVTSSVLELQGKSITRCDRKEVIKSYLTGEFTTSVQYDIKILDGGSIFDSNGNKHIEDIYIVKVTKTGTQFKYLFYTKPTVKGK